MTRSLPVVLLAPSEDKASGGRAGRLAETPAQRWVREKLHELVVHGTPEAQARAFDARGKTLDKARAEALALHHAVPLLPALERYQGVAFEALEAGSLDPDRWRQVYVLSNLRGLVRGDEPVPSYRLKMAGIPGLKQHWRRHLRPLLEALPGGPVWELLPVEHADLLKGWERPRHTVEILDAQGRAISHFSKKYRGLLARWILAHDQGDPARVQRGKIPGCRWEGAGDNDVGGRRLRLVVLP
jgi:hypothetical protein